MTSDIQEIHEARDGFDLYVAIWLFVIIMAVDILLFFWARA